MMMWSQKTLEEDLQDLQASAKMRMCLFQEMATAAAVMELRRRIPEEDVIMYTLSLEKPEHQVF